MTNSGYGVRLDGERRGVVRTVIHRWECRGVAVHVVGRSRGLGRRWRGDVSVRGRCTIVLVWTDRELSNSRASS